MLLNCSGKNYSVLFWKKIYTRTYTVRTLYFQDKKIIFQGTMQNSKRERGLEEGKQNSE